MIAVHCYIGSVLATPRTRLDGPASPRPLGRESANMPTAELVPRAHMDYIYGHNNPCLI